MEDALDIQEEFSCTNDEGAPSLKKRLSMPENEPCYVD